MEPKGPTKKRPADTAVSKSKQSASSRKDPPKKQKPNGDVGLAYVGPEVAAIIASFSDSFYGLSKLREVSKMFNEGVSQCKTYRITEKDISAGRHVAALRYVCRVAEGKTILLDPGDYNLEATFNSYEYESDDDIEEWDDYIEGMRFGKYLDTWKPGKGSLMIEADGITLRSSSPGRPASINFKSDYLPQDDPLIHNALIIKADDARLYDIKTSGGLSMYVVGTSISAKNCIFGGTATLCCNDASFEDCIICDGDYGGVSSVGDLTMTRCLFFDNSRDCLNGEGDYGVEFWGGKATFHDTFIQCDSEEDAQDIFDEKQHFEPVYDSEEDKWLIRLKDWEEKKKESQK